MDLPQIGAHCALPSCNSLDFLPITCKCAQSFCSNHIPPDRHDCALLDANDVTSVLPKFSEQLPRCAFDGCQKLSITGANSDTCENCPKSFCVEHRHPETHACPSLLAKEELKPRTSKPTTKPYKLPRKKPPTDPVKLAQWQKVEVMKMRHRAIPIDPKDKTASLPPDERLHVKVLVKDAEHIFWLRKTMITGRALDLIVKQLKLSITGSQPLNLYLPSQDEGQPDLLLPNDQILASQVMDGCTLILPTN